MEERKKRPCEMCGKPYGRRAVITIDSMQLIVCMDCANWREQDKKRRHQTYRGIGCDLKPD